MRCILADDLSCPLKVYKGLVTEYHIQAHVNAHRTFTEASDAGKEPSVADREGDTASHTGLEVIPTFDKSRLRALGGSKW